MIYQFVYGEDGFDGVAIEIQNFETLLISDAIFKQNYCNYDVPEEFEQLSRDRLYLRKNIRTLDDKCLLPLNIKRIIKQSQRTSSLISSEKLTADYIFQQITQLRTELRPIGCMKHVFKIYNPSELFCILFASILCSKQVLFRHKLNFAQFNWILSEIKRKYYKGLVQPGESVGILAAQSIGEPATQMTLSKYFIFYFMFFINSLH